MSPAPLLLKLRNARFSMTKAESLIVDKIIEDPSYFVHASARECSTVIGVSDASVIRFCQKYCGLSFQDFKETLHRELIESSQVERRSISPDIYIEDKLDVMIDKVESIINYSVRDTKALLNIDVLQLAITALEAASRLFFIGLGGSGLSAIEAGYKFNRIGFDANSFNEKHTMYYKVQYSKPDDLVVVISHSGETEDLIKATKTAQQNGSTILAITQNPQSSIGKLAQIVLQNSSEGELYQGDSIGTRISQMYLLDVLYTEALKHCFDQVKSSKINIRSKIN
ncbi:MurR/RpiR family transcriptional regulator [Celerinatantimonas diazotrophica]|uniref:RpiR family transcriptional regulator n=1 Tax=Celerinatantimonas diazotrophica TaxID=412034 RepID=A0A4R1K4U9_9GAMM|nr:MurR/RpiR family transcriptional regulator [Celerinatantimonas diazotrophica]TCK58970.1 RpiR family transcriptional regulator [Celerinatantimonas diazotrophica]CAG9297605.1 putative HTH-type transcriptional regulator YbbH [Celerinatantimonas diazotrophica]